MTKEKIDKEVARISELVRLAIEKEFKKIENIDINSDPSSDADDNTSTEKV